MADRLVLRLHNAQQGHGAIKQAWAHAKGWLMAGGQRLVLEIKPETRSDPQNRLLHATIAEIARQVEWAGAKRDPETWKRLLVSAWCRVHGEAVEILPALDGLGVDIVPRRTSKLTKAECSDLTEFVTAWAVEHGVALRDAQQWQVDPETGEIL